MIYNLYIQRKYLQSTFVFPISQMFKCFSGIANVHLWFDFCKCFGMQNHDSFWDAKLLLFKLISWCIKWHDGHGLVIRLIEYGHILIDATFLVFRIYWMYIIHAFFIGLIDFDLFWPLSWDSSGDSSDVHHVLQFFLMFSARKLSKFFKLIWSDFWWWMLVQLNWMVMSWDWLMWPCLVLSGASFHSFDGCWISIVVLSCFLYIKACCHGGFIPLWPIMAFV